MIVLTPGAVPTTPLSFTNASDSPSPHSEYARKCFTQPQKLLHSIVLSNSLPTTVNLKVSVSSEKQWMLLVVYKHLSRACGSCSFKDPGSKNLLKGSFSKSPVIQGGFLNVVKLWLCVTSIEKGHYIVWKCALNAIKDLSFSLSMSVFHHAAHLHTQSFA